MVKDNPLWEAPHIHSEILRRGFDIPESTNMGFMSKKNGNTSGQR